MPSSSTSSTDRLKLEAEYLYRSPLRWCDTAKFREWRENENLTQCESCRVRGIDKCTFAKGIPCDTCSARRRSCSISVAYRRAVFLERFGIDDATFDSWVFDWSESTRLKRVTQKSSKSAGGREKNASIANAKSSQKGVSPESRPIVPRGSRGQPPVAGQKAASSRAIQNLKPGVKRESLGIINLTDSSDDDVSTPPPRLTSKSSPGTYKDMMKRIGLEVPGKVPGNKHQLKSTAPSSQRRESQHQPQPSQRKAPRVPLSSNVTGSRTQVRFMPPPSESDSDNDTSDNISEKEEPEDGSSRPINVNAEIAFHRRQLEALEGKKTSEEQARVREVQLMNRFQTMEEKLKKSREYQRSMEKELQEVLQELKSEAVVSVTTHPQAQDERGGRRKRKGTNESLGSSSKRIRT